MEGTADVLVPLAAGAGAGRLDEETELEEDALRAADDPAPLTGRGCILFRELLGGGVGDRETAPGAGDSDVAGVGRFRSSRRLPDVPGLGMFLRMTDFSLKKRRFNDENWEE